MPKRGDVICGWSLIRQIGQGGNGTVWKATDGTGRLGALKVLHKRHQHNSKRRERFLREIRTMMDCVEVPGVLPLWASSLKDNGEPSSLLWLVTPVSTTLDNAFDVGLTLDSAVKVVASLAQTLSSLHSKDVSHRDIKPDNIFLHTDRWCLGDFGLATTMEDYRLTETGERIGAAHYIAPEMLNDAATADGKMADVYSLAKLLWRMTTNQRFPLPGWHDRHNESMTVSRNILDPRAVALDALIDTATLNEPSRRPTMGEFSSSLLEWLSPTALSDVGTIDLSSSFRKIQPHLEAQASHVERRAQLKQRGNDERERHFREFDEVFGEIETAFQKVGMSRIKRRRGGGNATFYRLETGNSSAGASDGRWFYQYDLTGELFHENGRAWLELGCNLGISQLAGEEHEIHDLAAPVAAAVGIVLWSSAPKVLANPKGGKLLFGKAGSFRYGHPEEHQYLQSATHNLLAAVPNACDALAERYKIVAVG